MNAVVHPVPPGSLIVVTGKQGDLTPLAEQLVSELVRVAGHDQFVVLLVPDGGGKATVIGSIELRARLAEALGSDSPHQDPPPEEPPSPEPAEGDPEPGLPGDGAAGLAITGASLGSPPAGVNVAPDFDAPIGAGGYTDEYRDEP